MWWGFLASVYWARTKPVLNHASTSSCRTTLSTIYKACAGSAEAFFFAPATERIIGEFGASNFLQHILAYIALFLFPKTIKPISMANKSKDYCFWKLFLIPRIASSFSKLTSCFQASAILISKFVKVSTTLLKAARSIRESYIQNATALTTGAWERAATIATLQLDCYNWDLSGKVLLLHRNHCNRSISNGFEAGIYIIQSTARVSIWYDRKQGSSSIFIKN